MLYDAFFVEDFQCGLYRLARNVEGVRNFLGAQVLTDSKASFSDHLT
jgi:hypothetical protein